MAKAMAGKGNMSKYLLPQGKPCKLILALQMPPRPPLSNNISDGVQGIILRFNFA